MSWTPLLCIALFFPLVAPAEAQSIYPLPSKKIIELGWDVPSPAYFRDNFRTMEHLPFDGVIIRLPADAGGGKVFEIDGWVKATGAARERELRIMREMPGSEKLTSNFLALYGASTMDWFSDADWGKVLENARFCARAAKASRCKGICWDPEPYSGINPWRYKVQPGYEQHTFAEYEQMARKRGAQFMRALQDEFPGLTIFSLRFLSDFQDGSPFSQRLLGVRDPRRRAEMLENASWALHPAFLNGLLDAASLDVTMIDGNEDAYYYTSAVDFYRVFHALRHDALALVTPESRRKYSVQVQIGQALAVDYIAGRWGDLNHFPDYLRKQALELTPVERARWFEHNVYYALTTADEYVWCYSEQQNWWTGDKVPPGFEEAIRSASRKYESGKPLGFTVEEMLQQAQTKVKTKERKGI